MRLSATFAAIGLALLVNFASVSSHAIDSRDITVYTNNNDNNNDLFARGKGGTGKGSSSGSGSGGKPPKQSSKLKKGSGSKAASDELTEWGLERRPMGTSDDVPSSYHWNDEENSEYQAVYDRGQWTGNEIWPDESHSEEYGNSAVYQYQTNTDANAFHTEAISMDTQLGNNRQRDLPTNRRGLTYNAWINAGGDPQDLNRLSDANIVNADGRAAFEDVFRNSDQADAFNRGENELILRVDRFSPLWARWDNGNNPFPDGYETMTVDYTDMQSYISYVMLYLDYMGQYHSLHVMEHVDSLTPPERVRMRANYFERKNLTDPLLA